MITTLQTARLHLQALSESELQTCQIDPDTLGQELGLTISPSMFTPVVIRAIQAKLAKMRLASRRDHRWYTYWLIVIPEQKAGIGLAGFKGAPNGRSQVEIGYGLAPEFEGQGYMTEAAGALVNWALSQPECAAVIAWTAKNNVASHRVLEKIGMVRDREQNNQWHWQKKGNSG